MHNCPTNKLRFLFFLSLKLLKQKTISSLMILQNMFTSGKLSGNMETTGVDETACSNTLCCLHCKVWWIRVEKKMWPPHTCFYEKIKDQKVYENYFPSFFLMPWHCCEFWKLWSPRPPKGHLLLHFLWATSLCHPRNKADLLTVMRQICISFMPQKLYCPQWILDIYCVQSPLV